MFKKHTDILCLNRIFFRIVLIYLPWPTMHPHLYFIQSSLLSKTHKTNIIKKLHKTKSTVTHSDRQAW